MFDGKELTKKRKEAGLSQESLAERLHISRELIIKWEKGTSIPPLDIIDSLAIALKMKPSEILTIISENMTSKPKIDRENIDNLKEQLDILFSHSSLPFGFYGFLYSYSTKIEKIKGVVYRDQNIFMFSKTFFCSSQEESIEVIDFVQGITAVILADELFNKVIIGNDQLIDIKPLLYQNGAYVFEITVNYPVFFKKAKFVPTNYSENIYLAFFL